MAVYGYARVSTHAQIDNTSLDNQQAEIRKKYPEIETMFVDRGVSGTIPWHERPEGKKLWRILKKGDLVVVWRMSRAFRSQGDFVTTLQRMKDSGLDFASLEFNGGQPVVQDKFYRAMMAIMATFAELEREMIAERTNEGRRVRQEGGFFVGGRPPWGMRIIDEGKLAEEPYRPLAVKMMRDMRLGGSSTSEVAAEVYRRFGVSISLPTVDRIVKRTEAELDDLIGS